MTKLAIDKVKLNDNFFFVDDSRARVNLSIKVIKNWIKLLEKSQKQNNFSAKIMMSLICNFGVKFVMF